MAFLKATAWAVVLYAMFLAGTLLVPVVMFGLVVWFFYQIHTGNNNKD